MMKWSVGTKIASGFALTLLIFVIVGMVAFASTRALVDSSSARQRAYEALDGLKETLSLVKDIEIGARSYALTGRQESLQPYEESIERIASHIRDERQWMQSNARQQQRFDRLERLIQQRIASTQDVIRARDANGLQGAAEIVTSGTMSDIRALIDEIASEEEAALEAYIGATVAQAQRALATITFGTIAAAMLSVLIAVLITRNISRPLQRLTQVAELLTVGNLKVVIPEERRSDEVGVLTRAFDRLAQSIRGTANAAEQIASGDLRTTVNPQSAEDALGNAFVRMSSNLGSQIRDLVEGAHVLGASASEIVATASQLATTANETAAAVSETTTTAEEVRQTARLATEKAKLVADAAEASMQASESGRQSADSVVVGMERVSEQMELIAASMVRLSEQSQAIGQIIAMVEDIASQSNLLAVNAAIEAAKAGEHGKGFGVVAHEVKSLADQSRQATSQVRTILTDIQKATSAAVMATEEGGKVVESGARETSAAAASLQTLANNASESAQAAVQIAASNQQQLVGVDQVAGAMESIRQATNQNVASAKQLEAAARNVHELGQRLKKIVDTYRV